MRVPVCPICKQRVVVVNTLPQPSGGLWVCPNCGWKGSLLETESIEDEKGEEDEVC